MHRRALIWWLALLSASASSFAGDLSYRVTGHIALADARWDYGTVDPDLRRLYLGRVGGVLALDLSSGTVTPVLTPSELVHGVVVLERGLLMITNGEADTVSFVDGLKGTALATLKVGKEPDAIIRDPRSGLVVVTNEGSHTLSLIDPVAKRLVATVRLPGKPEYPAASGAGLLYDNIEDRDSVAVIDLTRRRVLRLLPLPGCHAPTGLAYDAPDDLLLAVCRNGAALFLRGVDGHVLASFDVGAGPDAALFDLARHRAFVPAGGAGTLTVFSIDGANVRVAQTLATRKGSRTAILDPATGRLYVPAAEFQPAGNDQERPSPVPGTFEILVFSPNR